MNSNQLKCDFAKRLQKIMVVSQIEPKDLIEGLATHKSQVSRWVTGKVIPSSATLRRLSEFFSCNVEWLSSGKGPMFTAELLDRPTAIVDGGQGLSPLEGSEERVLQTYLTLAKLDGDFFLEVQNWIKNEQTSRPGFAGWFRLEFENRFPEFKAWQERMKQEAE